MNTTTTTYYGIATEALTDGFTTIPAGECVRVDLFDDDVYCAPQYRVSGETATVWLTAGRRLMVDPA